MKKSYTYKGRKLGWQDNGVFRKVVGPLDYDEKLDAWSIETPVLDDLPPECEIRLQDSATGLVYVTNLARFRKGPRHGSGSEYSNGIARTFFPRVLFDVIQLDGTRIESAMADIWWSNLQWFDQHQCKCRECEVRQSAGYSRLH